MSSVSRGFAQPITNTFSTSTDNSAWIHSLEKIEESFVSGSYIKIGSLYLVDTQANLDDFIDNVSSSGSGDYNRLEGGETVIDFGKNLTVGLQGGDSKILTFRFVKRTKEVSEAPRSGYIIVDNRSADDTGSLKARIYRN